MSENYIIQDTVKITATITDYNGHTVDPDTVSLKFYDCAGQLLDTVIPTGGGGIYTAFWTIKSDADYSQDITVVLDYTYAGYSFRGKTTFRVAPAVREESEG